MTSMRTYMKIAETLFRPLTEDDLNSEDDDTEAEPTGASDIPGEPATTGPRPMRPATPIPTDTYPTMPLPIAPADPRVGTVEGDPVRNPLNNKTGAPQDAKGRWGT
jgi:hypothetical protein